MSLILKEKTCLFVLGMHRSGTSAFTGTLQLLGVNLGSKLLQSYTANAKGHFENATALAINKEILSLFSSSWDDVTPLPYNWQNDQRLEIIKRKIRQLILSEFCNEELFAIKDPRLCITLPVWQEVLDSMDIKHKYVILLRHPMEVCLSLSKRNNFSNNKSYILWKKYLLNAEFLTRRYRRTFIDFQNDLLKTPQRTVEKVRSHLNIKFPVTDEKALPLIQSFIEPDLKHHRINSNNEDSALPKSCKELWDCLLQIYSNDDKNTPNFKPIDDIRADFEDESQFYYFEEMRHLIQKSTEMEKEIKSQNKVIKRISQENENLTKSISYKLGLKLTQPLRIIYSLIKRQ